MLVTPKSVTVLMVSGTALMEFTVKSETVEIVSGTTLTLVTAVSRREIELNRTPLGSLVRVSNQRYNSLTIKLFQFKIGSFCLTIPETALTASGTDWITCWPVVRAVLPVDLTKLKGVRRTS